MSWGFSKTIKIIIAVLVLLVSFSAESREFPSKYDLYFIKYTRMFLPEVNNYYEDGWKLLKAQCFQESLLIPNAVSPVGAKGLCQFMPRTFAEVSSQIVLQSINITDPGVSINAAAFYMMRQRAFWKSERSEEDRHSLAMASYNAGAGNILTSQKLCKTDEGKLPVKYNEIICCLVEAHLSKGRSQNQSEANAHETTTYVIRIWQFYREMIEVET